jgi:hypothetical protein
LLQLLAWGDALDAGGRMGGASFLPRAIWSLASWHGHVGTRLFAGGRFVSDANMSAARSLAPTGKKPQRQHHGNKNLLRGPKGLQW